MTSVKVPIPYYRTDWLGTARKVKIYVKSPAEAPPGANVQQGPQGGYFYEGTPQEAAAQEKKGPPGERSEPHPDIHLQDDIEGSVVPLTPSGKSAAKVIRYDPEADEMLLELLGGEGEPQRDWFKAEDVAHIVADFDPAMGKAFYDRINEMKEKNKSPGEGKAADIWDNDNRIPYVFGGKFESWKEGRKSLFLNTPSIRMSAGEETIDPDRLLNSLNSDGDMIRALAATMGIKSGPKGVGLNAEQRDRLKRTFRGMMIMREWCGGNFSDLAHTIQRKIHEQIANDRIMHTDRAPDKHKDVKALIDKWATRENLLAQKEHAKRMFEETYGESTTVYRGLSEPEIVRMVLQQISGETPRAYGTLYSTSDSMGVAENFAALDGKAVIKMDMRSDQCWGGWWNASGHMSPEERELIMEIPEEGQEITPMWSHIFGSDKSAGTYDEMDFIYRMTSPVYLTSGPQTEEIMKQITGEDFDLQTFHKQLLEYGAKRINWQGVDDLLDQHIDPMKMQKTLYKMRDRIKSIGGDPELYGKWAEKTVEFQGQSSDKLKEKGYTPYSNRIQYGDGIWRIEWAGDKKVMIRHLDGDIPLKWQGISDEWGQQIKTFTVDWSEVELSKHLEDERWGYAD